GTPPSEAGPDSVACASCELVLPPGLEGQRCPRCTAPIHRRQPRAFTRCTALTAATWVLAPIAYGYPMSQFWRAGVPKSHTVIDGVLLLFQNGFWFFGVVIFLVSVVFPFTKLVGLTWFLLSIRRGWSGRPRLKTELYRFVDDVGRWSVLDPFTVMVFTPMVQLGQLGHFKIMGGSEAFLATVVLSMLAARALDPRLIWDVATPGAAASVGPPGARAAVAP
ncbi:MAG: paraquat-inducible protein A, partial [Acetobacteraceae bacterium]|nr:paraquat-inducible protein A [Acetobacteraceae bacterium]